MIKINWDILIKKIKIVLGELFMIIGHCIIYLFLCSFFTIIFGGIWICIPIAMIYYCFFLVDENKKEDNLDFLC